MIFSEKWQDYITFWMKADSLPLFENWSTVPTARMMAGCMSCITMAGSTYFTLRMIAGKCHCPDGGRKIVIVWMMAGGM
jgi:hypothetical protein